MEEQGKQDIRRCYGEVSEAPILLSPTTYSSAAASGTRENRAKNIQSLTPGYNVEDGHRMRIAVKIRPEIKSEAPDTSLDLCLSTNLVMNITVAAKAIAESIASKSPNVKAVHNCKLNCKELLKTGAKNPDRAMVIPISCIFRNFSFGKNHARVKTTTVSSGPAKRPSFDAPTLVTESYHKNTAAAKNIEPLSSNFHDLNTVIFLFKKTVRANSRIAPAMGMLMPATRREDIPGISVRNSTITDSIESIIA